MDRQHTLITFIGRTNPDPLTGQKGYRKATYQFPGHAKRVTSASFGIALSGHLDPKPDAVLILGTAGSDWGVLVEHLAQGVEEEDARRELREAELEGSTTQGMLNRVTAIMSRGFRTCVLPRLIPVGETDQEQVEILHVIASHVEDGLVSIDVTHGLRYFGLIGFLSALMLEQLRDQVEVLDIWYGALDLTKNDVTPALRLRGLDRVRSWTRALETFELTGDYGIFKPLLVRDGVPEDKALFLERAAFHERTLNLQDAAKQLRRFLPVLEEPLAGTSGLFQRRLMERLSWCRESRLGKRQWNLAIQHLSRHDYLSAAVLGLEALVTSECERRGYREPSGDRYRTRQCVLRDIQADDRERYLQHEITPFRVLWRIRNALAHGDPPQDLRYLGILTDPDRLGRELERAIRTLRGRMS